MLCLPYVGFLKIYLDWIDPGIGLFWDGQNTFTLMRLSKPHFNLRTFEFLLIIIYWEFVVFAEFVYDFQNFWLTSCLVLSTSEWRKTLAMEATVSKFVINLDISLHFPATFWTLHLYPKDVKLEISREEWDYWFHFSFLEVFKFCKKCLKCWNL